MKRKLYIFTLIFMAICACFMVGACGGNDDTPDTSSQEQSSLWEDESIQDQEHSEVELPEIEI